MNRKFDPNYKLDDAAWARIDARIAGVMRQVKDEYDKMRRSPQDDALLHRCMDTLTACLEDSWPWDRAAYEAQRQGVEVFYVEPTFTQTRIESMLKDLPDNCYRIYDPRMHKKVASTLNNYSMRRLRITAQVAQVFGGNLTVGVLIKT